MSGGWPAKGSATVVLAATFLPLAIGLFAARASLYLVQLGTLSLILTLAAMGVNLLLGYTGRVSFGQAAFYGGAAYGTGIAVVRYGVEPWTGAMIGVVAAGILGAVFGLLSLRARGVYFLLITLALGQVVWGLAYRWVSMTGGDNGLPGIPRPVGSLLWPLENDRAFFLLTCGVFAVALAVMYVFIESPFGYALRGIGESESRMRTMGYPIDLYHYVAFSIAAVYAGLGGVLYAFYNGFVSPIDLHLALSAKVVLSVILGGTGTLPGPLVGTALVVLLENLLSSITQRWMFIVGVLYIIVVLYAPGGLTGLLGRSARGRVPATEASEKRTV